MSHPCSSQAVSVFLSDVETDPWPAGNVSVLAARSARWLVTRGEFGADEYQPNGNVTHLPAVKVSIVCCMLRRPWMCCDV